MKDSAAQDATAAQQDEIRHTAPLILSDAPRFSFTTESRSRGTFMQQQYMHSYIAPGTLVGISTHSFLLHLDLADRFS